MTIVMMNTHMKVIIRTYAPFQNTVVSKVLSKKRNLQNFLFYACVENVLSLYMKNKKNPNNNGYNTKNR